MKKRNYLLAFMIIGIISLVVLAFPILLLCLLEDLPVLLPMGIMFMISIQLFTPNPKEGTFMKRVISAELLEHIILPILLVVSMLVFNILWVFLFVIAICVIYGYILGEIKTNADILKVSILAFLIFSIINLPDYIWSLLLIHDMPGWIIWAGLTAFSIGVYLIANLNSLKKAAIRFTGSNYATPTKILVILSILILAQPVCADENELTLRHNLEYLMTTGDLDLVVQFIDYNGRLKDVDRLVCELTNPYGITTIFYIPRTSTGTYETTLNLDVSSIYYFQFLPTKPGYTFTNLETQVYAAKPSYTDISTYTLPLAIIIVIGGIAYLLKRKK